VQKGSAAPQPQADGVSLQRLTDKGHVVAHGLFFEPGKAELGPESEKALAELALLLTKEGSLKVHIVGHTDTAEPLASALALSQARAKSVREALLAKGVPAARMSAYGVGPYGPIASNRTEQGRAQNRRVEVVEQ